MTHPSDTVAVDKPSARFIPQSVGIIADVAGVSALIVGGGTPVVFASTLGAMLAGAYIIWKRWDSNVDRAVIAGFVIAVAGASVFGYALAESRADPVRHSVAFPDRPDSAENDNNPGLPAQPSSDQSVTEAPPTSADAPPSTPEIRWLADMTAVDGGDGWEHGSRTVNAKVYERSVVGYTCSPSPDTSEEAFNIERRFNRFQATIGLADDAPTNAATRFTVIVDGEEVYNRNLRLGEQAVVDVSVTNGLRLVLRVENLDSSQCSTTAVWGDANIR